MASPGGALEKNESYEADYTLPQNETVVIDIKDGRPSLEKVILHASQRISFRNSDARDYRLRLRHGLRGELVGACIFLEARKTAELITDPDACDYNPLAGHFAQVEILTPGQRVYTVYSGPVGPHGGGPRFELVVVSAVNPDTQGEYQQNE